MISSIKVIQVSITNLKINKLLENCFINLVILIEYKYSLLILLIIEINY